MPDHNTAGSTSALGAGDNLLGRVKITDGTDVADVLDLTASNPLAVAIVDSNGDQIASFGGGTQYTEDVAAAANPVGTAVILVRDDTPGALVSDEGDNVAQRGTNFGAAYVQVVDSSGNFIDTFGGAGGTSSADDADFVQTTTLGTPAMGVYESTPTSVTDNDMGIIGITQTRALRVAVEGTVTVASHAVTNAGTFVVQENGAALTALQLIDNIVKLEDDAHQTADAGVQMLAVRDDTLNIRSGAENDYEPLHTDANGALWVRHTSDAITVNSHAVTNAGTFAVQVDGAALTALQLIDDVVFVDDTATHSTGVTKGVGIMAAATPTDASVNANDIGMVAMTTDRKLHTAVMDALPAGANAIGKLAANSGVDIGDVDVTSVIPGTGATNLGKAEDGAHTSGDVGVGMLGIRMDSPNATFGATNDYTFPTTDMVGGIRTALYETDFAVLGTKHVKKYYANTGAVTDGIVWSPAAGTRWYVTDILMTISAAATVTFEDDLGGGDSIVMAFDLAANSGVAHHFGTPLFSGEDAADLIVTTTAGNVKIAITGYEI